MRGVRALLNWDESQWIKFRKEQDPDFDLKAFRAEREAEAIAAGEEKPEWVDTVAPQGVIENGSDETIYDVQVALRPIKFFGMSLGGMTRSLRPGQTYELPLGPEMNQRDIWDPAGHKPGLEAVFTDGRGARWNRTRLGRLIRLKPLRWFAPWRVPHELDRDELPWWAWRAKWHFRWDDHSYRNTDGYPPVWWAVDIRWVRWRYARKNDRLTIPVWRFVRRFKKRHEISARRTVQRLPLPWWAIDDRWRAWRWYRGELANDRAQRDKFEASMKEHPTK